MPYTIRISPLANDELKAIRKFDRQAIARAIDEQLTHQPSLATKNCKLLAGFSPAFDHVPPIWELRVAGHRVFYDVDEAGATVFIRASREGEAAPPDDGRDHFMKTINVNQLRNYLDDYLAEAAREDVIVTQGGRPWIVLRAASADAAPESLGGSSEFWETIQQRRSGPSLPWDEAKAQLGLD